MKKSERVGWLGPNNNADGCESWTPSADTHRAEATGIWKYGDMHGRPANNSSPANNKEREAIVVSTRLRV